MQITPPSSTTLLLPLPLVSPFRDPFVLHFHHPGLDKHNSPPSSRSHTSPETARRMPVAPAAALLPPVELGSPGRTKGRSDQVAGMNMMETQEPGRHAPEKCRRLATGGPETSHAKNDMSNTSSPSHTYTLSPTDHHRNRPLSAFVPTAAGANSSSPPVDTTLTEAPPSHTDTSQDQSFMRWSKTASTIFSEAPSSHFYFNKRLTGQYTDVGGASERHGRFARIDEEEEVKQRGGEKRTSNGTFGKRPRRWSAMGSSSTGSIREDPFLDDTETPPFEEANETKSNSTGANRPKLRRPLSMSSASDSTFSAPTMDTRATKPSPNGYFPSPTHRRPSHKSPETAQAIDAHLLKSSAKNESKIVPRGKPLAPPSIGTPLKGGGVKEESQYGDSSESDFGVQQKRAGSKLDQVLGEGAETARILMQLEKRAMETVLEMPPPGGPKPPARYKHSPSMSTDSAFSPPSTPQRDTRTRRRSSSVDSVPSLHPSLSDSITTLSQLLPNSPPQLKPLPAARHPTIPRLPPNVPVSERAMLLRRARKLESILGEPLPESAVEKHVVDPIHTSTTVTTKITHDFPSSPPRDVPEWEREDVAPRTIRDPRGGASSLGKGNKKLAERARAALGLGGKEGEKDLRVYVEREMRMSETCIRGQDKRPGLNRTAQSSPSTPVAGSPSNTVDLAQDETIDGQRTRRQQLAKLHRLLGVPIPPSLVMSRPNDSTSSIPTGVRTSDASAQSFMTFDEGNSPTNKWASKFKQTFSHDKKASKADSFMDLREIKHGDSVSSRTSVPPMLAGQSMTEKEKATARKRAAKLEQVFGYAPPQDLYLASTRSSNESSKSAAKIDAFGSYEQSLQGLLNLADHDPDQLVNIVDSLDEASPHRPLLPLPPSPGSPDSPTGIGRSHEMIRAQSDGIIDPNSHAARRHRAGKLSQFFGESNIDFQHPPPLPPAILAKERRSKRRETMEGVLSEMWRNMQWDAARGGIGELELRKLGDMMSVLKRRSGGVWEEIEDDRRR